MTQSVPPTPILNTLHTGITSSSMRRSMSEAKIVAKPGDGPNYNTLPNPRLSKTNRYVMFALDVSVIITH